MPPAVGAALRHIIGQHYVENAENLAPLFMEEMRSPVKFVKARI